MQFSVKFFYLIDCTRIPIIVRSIFSYNYEFSNIKSSNSILNFDEIKFLHTYRCA